MELSAKARKAIGKIELILLDVDGVLTDGRVSFLPGGAEVKFFSIYDGLGIKLARSAGWKVGFLSARGSLGVEDRARELGVDVVVQNSDDKNADFDAILEKLGLADEQVAYMGDDLHDLPVLRRAGFSVAPANAVEAVKAVVDHVTENRGGEGAVRELIDTLLKAAGKSLTY